METIRAFRNTAFSKGVALIVTMLTALMLAAGALAATGSVTNARASDGVDLTYTVWFSPNMTGVFGGDFAGTFGGAVLSRTPIPNTPLIRMKVLYVLTAEEPSLSFTAIVKGNLNTVTNSAVLNGEVTGGWLTEERAHSRFHVISGCPGKPSGPCFQGTLRIS